MFHDFHVRFMLFKLLSLNVKVWRRRRVGFTQTYKSYCNISESSINKIAKFNLVQDLVVDLVPIYLY